MYLFYIDDSSDRHFFTFSALGIQDSRWNEFNDMVSAFRENLKARYGIYIRKELHATKFLSGRGRPSAKHLSKTERVTVFMECLAWAADLHKVGAILFNVVHTDQNFAFERMLNRINRTLQPDVKNDLAMLICDEGKEWEYTKLVRRMRVYNPIPSQFKHWAGNPTRNITLDRIIEDPVFKKSHRSTIIQIADFCAYALLRQELPVASKTALGIDKAFPILAPICFKPASPRDPRGLGIIR